MFTCEDATHALPNACKILYRFNQFVQHVTFPRFRKISENQKNQEKNYFRGRKNWMGQGTDELI